MGRRRRDVDVQRFSDRKPVRSPTAVAPKSRRRRRSLVGRIGDFLAAFGPWIILAGVVCALWPVQFGGSTSFSIVSGRSMERTYHTGDLVITKRRSTYNVGDIVVYRIPGSDTGHGREVVHRLHTRLPDGTFLAQGDNNRTVDPWTITNVDIVGSKWLMIPRGGLFLGFLRSPMAASMVIGGLVAWAAWPRRNEAEPNGRVPVAAAGASPAPRIAQVAVVAEVAAVGQRFELHWLDDDGIPDVSEELASRIIAPPKPTESDTDDWLTDARIKAAFATSSAGLLRPAPEPSGHQRAGSASK